MALVSNAAMVLFYDIDGNTSDHDDWHSYEHFHERLSVPGFLRATRWVATQGAPRYMVIYEVSDVDVATSQSYLDRLNNPTEWTRAIMPRFRGMTRGFCHVTASNGFGQGRNAFVMRFRPKVGAEKLLTEWISQSVLPDAASRRGMTSTYLLTPTAPPPMTREQSLRGPDEAMPWLMVATSYDSKELKRTVAEHITSELFRDHGADDEVIMGFYALDHTATAAEAKATPQPQMLSPEIRVKDGPRR